MGQKGTGVVTTFRGEELDRGPPLVNDAAKKPVAMHSRSAADLIDVTVHMGENSPKTHKLALRELRDGVRQPLQNSTNAAFFPQ